MKNKKLSLFVAVVFVSLVCVSALQASTFTDASLKGTYAFWDTADVQLNRSNACAIVGTATFDGAGHVSLRSTQNVGGLIVQKPIISGTYAVSANGTAAMTFLVTGDTMKFALALNSIGSNGVAGGFYFTGTGSAGIHTAAERGFALLTGSASFTKASLKGSYAFQIKLQPLSDSDDTEITGVMTFNGAGSVSVAYTQNKNGVFLSGSTAGSYSIAANGIGSAIIHPNGSAVNLTIVASASGKQVYLLGADASGNVELGVATHQ